MLNRQRVTRKIFVGFKLSMPRIIGFEKAWNERICSEFWTRPIAYLCHRNVCPCVFLTSPYKSLMIYESALVVVAWSHEPFITVTTFIGAHRTTWFSPNMLPNMTLNHLDVYDKIFFGSKFEDTPTHCWCLSKSLCCWLETSSVVGFLNSLAVANAIPCPVSIFAA